MPFNEELPEWNQEGAEPSQDKKDNGFAVLERPPAGLFDWFFNRTSRALQAFKDLFNNHEKDYIAHTGFAVTTGTATAYVITLNPGPAELKKGMSFKFQAHVDSGVDATLKVNGTNAGTIVNKKGAKTTTGTFKKDMIYEVTWSGTSFILQGEGGGEYGTATEHDVLIGKTIGTENGVITGTMPNIGRTVMSPSTVNRGIPKGYHDGTGYVEGNPNLIPGNIREGVNIFGIVGNYGQKVEYVANQNGGTVVNITIVTSRNQSKTSDTYRVPHNGTIWYSFDIGAGENGTQTGQLWKNGVAIETRSLYSSAKAWIATIPVSEGDIFYISGGFTRPDAPGSGSVSVTFKATYKYVPELPPQLPFQRLT